MRVITALLRKAARLLAPANPCRQMALLEAVARGKLDVLRKELATGTNPNFRMKGGSALLPDLAISDQISEEGRLAVLQVLLEAGADIEQGNGNGSTALMLAAGAGHDDLVRALLAAGAKVNARDAQKDTALIWAASMGRLAALQPLLAAGANVNAKNRDGRSALMYAAHKGLGRYITELIAAGADCALKDKSGATPLLLASGQGHFEASELLRARLPARERDLPLLNAAAIGSLEDIRRGLARGADLEQRNEHGFSALELAVIYGRREAVQLLLTQIKDERMLGLALSCACLAESEELTAFLLASGAKPDVPDGHGETALMLAVSKNFAPGVQLLLDHGADWSKENRAGQNAIDIGQERNALEALQLIFQHKRGHA